MLSDLLDKINANVFANATSKCVLGSIVDTDNTSKDFMTLIKIEEESVLKNIPNTTFKDGKYQKKHPKIYLNYYLMFIFSGEYIGSIAKVHNLIKYFQATKVFSKDDKEIVMELFSPSFEQINQIISINGGKHHPCVFYKARVTEWEYDIVVKGVEPIHTITKTIGHEN